jgi:excisionase family DNA binding protein
MHRRLQFGMRENPASDRRHGSRFAHSTKSLNSIVEQATETHSTLRLSESAFTNAHATLHAATPQAATVEKSRSDNRLLTVREVAELLRVPVSWVYGRTRKRSLERLPGYRLGKYWRFREEEIHTWLRRQGGELCGS